MAESTDLRAFGALAQMAHHLREAAERTEDVANRAAQLETEWAQYKAIPGDDDVYSELDPERRKQKLEAMAKTLREVQDRVRATESDVQQLALLHDVQQTAKSGDLKQAGQLMLGVQAGTAGKWKDQITRAWQEAMGL